VRARWRFHGQPVRTPGCAKICGFRSHSGEVIGQHWVRGARAFATGADDRRQCFQASANERAGIISVSRIGGFGLGAPLPVRVSLKINFGFFKFKEHLGWLVVGEGYGSITNLLLNHTRIDMHGASARGAGTWVTV
jgi:hypothetical protein